MARVHSFTNAKLSMSFRVSDATTEGVARENARQYVERFIPDDRELGYFDPEIEKVGRNYNWRVEVDVDIYPGDEHAAGIEM